MNAAPKLHPGHDLAVLAVEKWPIDRLLPYAGNSRTHSDAQVAQVAASIVEFGWTNPILAGADGVIIAGHARLAAARKLGMDEVPVIVLDHLSKTQRRALVIADNKLALNADWDVDALKVEMDSLRDESFALELVGFSQEELGALMEVAPDVEFPEFDETAADDVKYQKCPSCGHEFPK